jgi:hypothetical protein
MIASPGKEHHAPPRSARSATPREEEAALFAAAARALRAPEPDPPAPFSAPGPEPARHALWLRTGAAPPAPMAMPEQLLAPGVLGVLWRRLRAALELAAHDEPR